MITLEQFKANAQDRGICEMIKDWDNAKSKKQLMDIALSIRGVEYLSESIAQGWGISPEVIAKEFEPFNNGKYVFDSQGYTSSMHCFPNNVEIKPQTTVCLIIGHDGEVRIDRPCELYLVNSDVVIKGTGRPHCFLYNSTIINPDGIAVVDKQVEY